MSVLRCFVSAAFLTLTGLAANVDFQREVRPILADNCFACHGPDKTARMADLRLDLKEDALAERANGAAIVPGDPAKSLLYQRITAQKNAVRMPPQYSNKSLKPEQIETLRRWIEQGAPWQEHWSFVAPRRPPLPAVKNAAWTRNPIDRFVLAKLEAANFQPAPEAERRKLIRRAALDITGLPPEADQVEAFLADTSSNAYEQMIDRLLASARWGEHRGRYWLDAARYADTHGIHVDNYREMWPYRDWVINAFNRNMPFDQFTIEQLAGDLLPNPTLDQQIATGFHRCNVTTNEAGIILDEFEAIYAKDRADTTSEVWLGLTLGCATCHDHKFDPLSARDHYSLEAFFKNTTQAVMDGNISDTPPIVIVPNASDRERWIALQAEQASAAKQMAALAEGAVKKPSRAPARPIDDGSEIFAYTQETVFDSKKTVDLPNQEVFDSTQPFSMAFRLRMPEKEESLVAASQYDRADDGRGWIFEISARVPNFKLVGDGGKSLDARAGHMDQLMPGTVNHVVITYDGSGERIGIAMYINGKPVTLQGAEPLTALKGNFKTNARLRLGGDTRRGFEGGAVSDFRVFNRVLSDAEATLAGRWADLQKGDERALHLYYLHHEDAAYRGLKSRMAALRGEWLTIRHRAGVTHVMQERADTKPEARILYRGMYDQPRERVEAGIPAVLPPMPASYPRNRLGLAQWLVHESNPLTARVTVNRFWQEVFGTGLVKTSEDFGAQGEAASHPELLDWLAVEFRESGWDVKKLYRLMLTSAAYRQSTAATEEKIRRDPENRLLSRGPRFRMDGEMVRDYALAASGLLTNQIGGPSVKPYQPENVWETVAMLGSNTRFYKRDSGEKLYRRSLYTFWKRSAPPASMDIFNAPTREQCTLRRDRTNTPLQALVTMDDVQFVEAARVLAQRAILSAGDFYHRVNTVSSRLLARPLDEKERSITQREYQDFLRYYDGHPDDAKKLIAFGEWKADATLAPAELAAMTMLVNQLMNLDEVLNK